MHASNPQAKILAKLHPTVKPVPMIMDALLDCSAAGDIVLDSFGGSGSTLIAAERTKRKARLIELDFQDCKIAKILGCVAILNFSKCIIVKNKIIFAFSKTAKIKINFKTANF